MQFTTCHTTAMSFSVLESTFSVWLQMLVPMSQATNTSIPVHNKFEAPALAFPNTNCSVGIGYRVLRSNKGWLAAVLGFLLQDFGRVCAALLKKNDQLFFACCRSMSLHIFATALAFLLFFRVLGGLAHHNTATGRQLLCRVDVATLPPVSPLHRQSPSASFCTRPSRGLTCCIGGTFSDRHSLLSWTIRSLHPWPCLCP